MRLAVLIFAALLVGLTIAGQALAQDVAAVGSGAAVGEAPNPLADKIVEIIMLAVGAGVIALQAWLRQRLRTMLTATVAGVEQAGDPAVKAAIQAKAEKAGVEGSLARVVEKETKRLEKEKSL